MADNFRFAQLQPYSLAGSGAVLGDTTLTLKSMTDIDGTALSMSGTFGTVGYGTLEPGNGNQEEQISFTGLTNNSNGTTTLTGVKSVSFTYPYTETSGLLKTHPGSSVFIISNTSGFYDKLTSKSDDETITGTWTFTNPNYPRMDTDTPFPVDNEQLATKAYADSLTFSGAPDASPTQKGIVQIATSTQVDGVVDVGSTGAYLVITPSTIAQSIYGTRLPTAGQKAALSSTTSASANNLYITQSDEQKAASYTATSSGSANNYTVTLTPTPAAYTDGMIVHMKAGFTNSASARVNVNGLGNKPIVKLGSTTEVISGDIATGQEIILKYDGTSFQMVNPVARLPLSTVVRGTITDNNSVVVSTGGGTNTDTVVTHGLGVKPSILTLSCQILAANDPSTANGLGNITMAMNGDLAILWSNGTKSISNAGSITAAAFSLVSLTTPSFSVVGGGATATETITVSITSITSTQFTFRINGVLSGSDPGQSTVTNIVWSAIG